MALVTVLKSHYYEARFVVFQLTLKIVGLFASECQ